MLRTRILWGTKHSYVVFIYITRIAEWKTIVHHFKHQSQNPIKYFPRTTEAFVRLVVFSLFTYIKISEWCKERKTLDLKHTKFDISNQKYTFTDEIPNPYRPILPASPSFKFLNRSMVTPSLVLSMRSSSSLAGVTYTGVLHAVKLFFGLKDNLGYLLSSNTVAGRWIPM
jgi:hypothetical protein